MPTFPSHVQDSPPRLSLGQRRALFAALVEAQDAGVPVAESRSRVAKQFKVRPEQVRAIEDEGVKADWPPL